MDLEDLKLTVEDLERFGPTLIVDHKYTRRRACPRLVAVTVPVRPNAPLDSASFFRPVILWIGGVRFLLFLSGGRSP